MKKQKNKYVVLVRDISRGTVTIEADSAEEAMDIVVNEWDCSRIDWDDGELEVVSAEEIAF